MIWVRAYFYKNNEILAECLKLYDRDHLQWFLEFINIVIFQLTMLTTPLLINIKTVETSLGTFQKLLESSF